MGREGPLEKGMETQSSIVAWRIPWTEKPGRLQFVESQRVKHERVTNTFPYFTGQRTLETGKKKYDRGTSWASLAMLPEGNLRNPQDFLFS